MVNSVTDDAKTNWAEGLVLLSFYIMIVSTQVLHHPVQSKYLTHDPSLCIFVPHNNKGCFRMVLRGSARISYYAILSISKGRLSGWRGRRIRRVVDSIFTLLIVVVTLRVLRISSIYLFLRVTCKASRLLSIDHCACMGSISAAELELTPISRCHARLHPHQDVNLPNSTAYAARSHQTN